MLYFKNVVKASDPIQPVSTDKSQLNNLSNYEDGNKDMFERKNK